MMVIISFWMTTKKEKRRAKKNLKSNINIIDLSF